jgi:hypothetical protein
MLRPGRAEKLTGVDGIASRENSDVPANCT